MIGRRKQRMEEDDFVAPKGFDDFDLRLGDLMRGERATLGKSLLDVQRELKIRASYISAIENADPTAFETPGFIAGYVRSYARYLGMDPERAFGAFCAESGFSTAHGMSDDASSIKKSRAADILAAPSAGRDPFAQPATPFVPAGDAFLSRVEPGAVGSTLVLVALLGAIGFGGWTVLNQVQQVSVAPVEDTPIALTELDPVTRASARTPLADSQTPAQGAGTAQATDTIADLNRPAQDGLDRLYRPKALDTPVLVARDAPISTLDPQTHGAFANLDIDHPRAPSLGGTANEQFDTDAAVAAAIPRVVGAVPDQVQLVAVRPAWVRVKAADGTTVFEGIMDACDTVKIPITEEPPTLRVGESSAVYFTANGQHFGPAGPRGQVTSGVVLSAQALSAAYPVADLSGDNELAHMVADASGATTAITYSCE